MKNYTLFTVFLLNAALVFGGNPSDEAYKQDYLSKFAPLAQSEMRRVGIPASIKLAQGILESSWGRSELTLNSNNHFGIKCKTADGFDCYFKKDDDENLEGELIKSPFRKYHSAEASYLDHSNFLYQNPRYALCFEQGMDYRAWAHALKNCGYATAEDYAEKIISTIREYNLDRYDVMVTPFDQAVTTRPTGAAQEAMHIVSVLDIEYRYIYRIMDFEMTGLIPELPTEATVMNTTPTTPTRPVASEAFILEDETAATAETPTATSEPKASMIEGQEYEPVAPPENSASMARKLSRYWDLPQTF